MSSQPNGNHTASRMEPLPGALAPDVLPAIEALVQLGESRRAVGSQLQATKECLDVMERTLAKLDELEALRERVNGACKPCDETEDGKHRWRDYANDVRENCAICGGDYCCGDCGTSYYRRYE